MSELTKNCLKNLLFFFKRVIKGIIVLFFLMVVFLGGKFFYTVHIAESGKKIVENQNYEDLDKRTTYLLNRITEKGNNGEYVKLEEVMPGEWALVTYSMLGAAITNIAFRFPETKNQALVNLKKIIELTLRKNVSAFDTRRWNEEALESLSSSNAHIGYLGHLNWLLSAYSILGGHDYDDLFEKITSSLVRRYEEKEYRCLLTYPSLVPFSADNIVVVASIANYSKINGGKYAECTKEWVKANRKIAASTNSKGLPHIYDYTCNALGDVRGSTAGWNSFYLPYIDKKFADEQYELMKKTFYQKIIFGGFREYLRGQNGSGDMDSGPVILGFSPSGTGFALGGLVHHGDIELIDEVLFTAEFVGTTYNSHKDGRFYLLAPIVGDAIMLAMKTAIVWDTRYIQPIFS